MASVAILVAILLLILTPKAWTQFRDHLFQMTHDDEIRDYQQGPGGRAAPKAADPCHASYHRVIRNQPLRSYNYRLGSSTHRDEVLCDRDLDRGWYRFESLAGNVIPTSCPGINYCGTRAPVWMKGLVPSVSEGVTETHACVSVQGKCCTTQIPMLVKNCSSFVVYHLEPTPACPSAYCVGYEVPCPGGLSSDSGYTPCHFPVDLLEAKVSYGLSKDSTQVQFFCDVTLGGHVVPESVALEVEWLADGESIQTETFGLVQQHKGILKEDKWHLGQTLQCRARARHSTINTFTGLVTSPPFSTGIVFKSAPIITLQEGGDPGFIEFEATLPPICPPKKKKKAKPRTRERSKRTDEETETEAEADDENGCCVTFEVSTHSTNAPRCPDGTEFDLIVLTSCTVKVCADDWNVTQRVAIWGLSDGLRGLSKDNDQATVMVELRSAESSPPRWQELSLPTQEIHVIPGDVSEKCQTDEMTMTFDGLVYANRLDGVFVLYKHQKLPYEVQVLLQKCTGRPMCNCGVAIRFGDAMLAAEVCKTGKLRLWTFTSEGTYIEPAKVQHLPQILRIDEGRTFQIQFPSGTRVSFGPNLRFVRIQASATDLEQTLGLCGSFDRDVSNELKTYKGVLAKCQGNLSSCDEFSKAWRLPPDQSLFHGVFHGNDNDDEESLSPGRCSCSGLPKTPKADLRPKAKSKFASYPYDDFGGSPDDGEEDGDTNKCSSTACGDPRGTDVTLELLELLQEEDFSNDVSLERDPSHGIATDLQPLFISASPSESELLQRDWREQDAEVVCLRAIETTSTAKLCRDVAHIDVEHHRNSCQQEVLLTKSGSRSRDALEQLRWECRDEVYHNVSIWEPQLGRPYGTPPQALLAALCLNNCSGLGTCQAGVCSCLGGFGGSDCSVNVNEGPQVTSVDSNGVCDLRNKACGEVLVWGTRFAQHPAIKCHFEVYRTSNVRSVPTLSGTLTTEGRLFTFQSIICDVPELPIHDAKIASFYIPGEGLDKTRTLLRLSVSYGLTGVHSPVLDYTIFDSLCWTCESPLGCVPTPTQSCNVLSEPFGSSSDPLFQNNPFGEGQNSGFRLPLSPTLPPASHPGLGGPCRLPKQPGPCREDIVRYYFEFEGQKCKPFIFGGCEGNSNNFENADACTGACVKPGVRDDISSSSSAITRLQQLPPKCRVVPDTNCQDSDVVQYYYDPIQNRCRPGISCRTDSFPDLSACAAECRPT